MLVTWLQIPPLCPPRPGPGCSSVTVGLTCAHPGTCTQPSLSSSRFSSQATCWHRPSPSSLWLLPCCCARHLSSPPGLNVKVTQNVCEREIESPHCPQWDFLVAFGKSTEDPEEPDQIPNECCLFLPLNLCCSCPASWGRAVKVRCCGQIHHEDAGGSV